MFSPEEATSQSIKHIVCSQFAFNIYKELLNITIPETTNDHINYSRIYKGKPEVIAYSEKTVGKNIKMFLKFKDNKKGFSNLPIESIIPDLQIGDLLTYQNSNGGGHTIMVYDLIKDEKGNVKDANIIESTVGIGKAYINSKICNGIKGSPFTSSNHYLYLNKKNNNEIGEEGREEGSLGIKSLLSYRQWKVMNNLNYSILRFIHNVSNTAVLKYTEDINNNNKAIILSEKNMDRKKFPHLYIEKTFDRFNDTYVKEGETITFKIKVKNAGKSNYKQDLTIVENISPKVEYLKYSASKASISFKYRSSGQIEWNLGKLKPGEEIIIHYTVRLISGDFYESSGKVGNIPSSKTINITTGNNLGKSEQNYIKEKYEFLKDKFDGSELLNEIYKEAFDIDIKLNEFNISKLINNIRINSNSNTSIKLFKDSALYKSILNKYWSGLAKNSNLGIDNYDLKIFGPYENPERRQDFIYPETLKTGDILFYENYNDIKYNETKNDKLNITNEYGEYWYIYIENIGFVGKNYGKDGKHGRNEFSPKYYEENKLTLFYEYDHPDDEILKTGNLQTLFGKDYYVILRPSLQFNCSIKCKEGMFLNNEKKCLKCPAGQYSNKGDNSCIKCNSGFYSDKEGSSHCIKCPANYYSSEGEYKCTACPKGSYSSAGSSSCKQCPGGQYLYKGKCEKCNAGKTSNPGAIKCINCPAGTYSNKEGSIECKKCKAGTYSKTGYKQCINCQANYYSSEGAISCKPCPKGSYSSEGSSSCQQCPAGQYLYKGKCEKCNAGKTSNPGAFKCFNCPAGTFSKDPGSPICTKCAAGTYSEEGAKSCITCPKGSYSQEGSSSCQQCPAGQYLYKGKCEKCNAGKYSNPGAIKCINCPAGTYSNKGSGICYKCLAGFYSNEGSSVCKKCPSGTYSKSWSIKCIKCAAGYYSSDGASFCKICPAGKYSSAGSKSCLTCPKGKTSKPGASYCR